MRAIPDSFEMFKQKIKILQKRNQKIQELKHIFEERSNLEDYYQKNLFIIAKRFEQLFEQDQNDILCQLCNSISSIISSQAEQSKIFVSNLLSDNIENLKITLPDLSELQKTSQEQISELTKLSQQLSKDNKNQEIYNSKFDDYHLFLETLCEEFYIIEDKMRKSIKDNFMKYGVYQISLLRNIQYDVDRVLTKLEKIDLQIYLKQILEEQKPATLQLHDKQDPKPTIPIQMKQEPSEQDNRIRNFKELFKEIISNPNIILRQDDYLQIKNQFKNKIYRNQFTICFKVIFEQNQYHLSAIQFDALVHLLTNALDVFDEQNIRDLTTITMKSKDIYKVLQNGTKQFLFQNLMDHPIFKDQIFWTKVNKSLDFYENFNDKLISIGLNQDKIDTILEITKDKGVQQQHDIFNLPLEVQQNQNKNFDDFFSWDSYNKENLNNNEFKFC